MPYSKHRLELSFDLALSLAFGMSASAKCLIRHAHLNLIWPCTCMVGVAPYFPYLTNTRLAFVCVLDLPLHIAIQVMLLPFQ